MATYYEAVLPSGRCVRFEALSTRKKLEVERRVTEVKGDDITDAVYTLATALRAYTAPQKLVFVQAEKRVGDAVRLVDTPEVDVDRTIEAVPETAWVKTTYEELVTEGPTNLLEIFDKLPDFRALRTAVANASGFGAENASLLAGKVRVASAGP